MSWVFLTEHCAYKLKKPVRYNFLDFSTLEARRWDCTEEVRLNLRLAPDVYLGTVPLTIESNGNVGLGGPGDIIDWLVKMRRLPADQMLDYTIKHHTVNTAHVHSLALVLVDFYKNRPGIKISGARYASRLQHDVQTNLLELALPSHGLSVPKVEFVHHAQLEVLRRSPEFFDERVRQGRIIEGHGDLRPEHICLERKPVIFDCLEFNRAFRILDRADELSFLAMECERIGAPHIGRLLFTTYEELSGDSPEPRLVLFFKAYRACLRARLAVWHMSEIEKAAWPKWQGLANDYLNLAAQYSARL